MGIKPAPIQYLSKKSNYLSPILICFVEKTWIDWIRSGTLVSRLKIGYVQLTRKKYFLMFTSNPDKNFFKSL